MWTRVRSNRHCKEAHAPLRMLLWCGWVGSWDTSAGTPQLCFLQACYATASLAELRDSLGEDYGSFSVIAIDEAQFLPDLLQFCSHAADVDRKCILVAGLDGDFRRQRFGQVGLVSSKSAARTGRCLQDLTCLRVLYLKGQVYLISRPCIYLHVPHISMVTG